MHSLLSPLEPTGGGVVLPLVLDWTRVGAPRGFLWLVVLFPGPVAGGTGLSWRLFCLCPLVVPPAAFDSPLSGIYGRQQRNQEPTVSLPLS